MGTFSEFISPARDRHEAGRQAVNQGDYWGILDMLAAYPELAAGAIAGGVGELSGYLGQDQTQQRKLARDVIGMTEMMGTMGHTIAFPARAPTPQRKTFSTRIVDDGRPTQHFTHSTSPLGVDLQYTDSPGRWPASDLNSAYRITGSEQIADMIDSGLVRSKPPGAKAKGGRTGVTHWSQGRDSLVYDWDGIPDSYILKAPSKGLNGRHGGIPLHELEGIYEYRAGTPTNILNEVISANMQRGR